MRLLTISINDSSTVGCGDLCIEHNGTVYCYEIPSHHVGKFVEKFNNTDVSEFLKPLAKVLGEVRK